MTSINLKIPAPAMGPHSYHKESPPFGAVATSDLKIPPEVSLGPSPNGDGEKNERSSPSQSSDSVCHSISALEEISQPQPPSDEDLIKSRSRRLVSGYMFGSPPSSAMSYSHTLSLTEAESVEPFASRRLSPMLEAARDVKQRMSDDSLQNILNSSGAGGSPTKEHGQKVDRDDTPRHLTSTATADETVLSDLVETTDGLDRKKSERTGKTETGYDALEGRNDGEADLDLNAPQDEGGGSGAYLAGKAPYVFPQHRLRNKMHDESKIPLVIVACGSFSPPTYLHLRMFEMAKDEILESQMYEIMAGYYSPVSSYYKKPGLAPAPHRVRMCELTVEHTSTWLMVDPWEAGQDEYQRTAVVLDHFDQLLNGGQGGQGGVKMRNGKRRRYKVMLLAGGDLIESFGEPGVWSEPDLHIILGRFGCLIVERAGSDVWAFLLSHDILYHHRRNVIVIKQLIYNDISSTKVRLFVRRGMSIKYLLPNSVIQYIHDQKLYSGSDSKGMFQNE
ncbi:nicotinate (nicotinamide) nucleotide adenylyltransferase [Cryptococcus depauperatus CBS 7841]|uniref:Nicotinate (Nicotinamide) nucleotide adenylyltransferase n=1 Tax=Cryptococcus depauperatus CBS 7841 TaxID=1295531 RepID=A0AAJ8JTA3_9TREE